jgi:hypothetical protein
MFVITSHPYYAFMKAAVMHSSLKQTVSTLEQKTSLLVNKMHFKFTIIKSSQIEEVK